MMNHHASGKISVFLLMLVLIVSSLSLSPSMADEPITQPTTSIPTDTGDVQEKNQVTVHLDSETTHPTTRYTNLQTQIPVLSNTGKKESAHIYHKNGTFYQTKNIDILHRFVNVQGCTYLIITHPDFQNQALTLATWRQKTGKKTEIVPIDTFNPQDIKDIITERYLQGNLEYVLFIGDVQYIPAKYWEHYKFPEWLYHTDNGVLSDYWYSCMEHPTYGLIDPYADVAIGRLSVQTEEQAEHQIQKILAYEKNPPRDNWLKKNLMIAGNGDLFGQTEDAIISEYLEPAGFTCDRAYLKGENGTSRYVSLAIDEGRGIVNYRGQALPNGLAWIIGGPGEYEAWMDWPHVQHLYNFNRTPVFFNIVYWLNDIDYETDSLGEALMNKYPGGAVASIGGTEYFFEWDYTYGFSDSFYGIPFNTFDTEIYRQLFKEENYVLGDLLNEAKHTIIDQYDKEGEAAAAMFLLLGDPAMTIWTDIPQYMRATRDTDLTLGQPKELTIHVEKLTGGSVADATVCLQNDDDLFEVCQTNELGDAHFSVTPQSKTDITVTVTAHNFIPFETTLSVGDPVVENIRTHKQYTSIQSAIDEAHDEDTILIPGGTFKENIAISKSISLKGIGSEQTTITAKSSADTVIRVTDAADVKIQDLFIAEGIVGLSIRNSNDILVNDCSIDNAQTGVQIDSSQDITIQNSRISRCNWGLIAEGNSNTIHIVDNIFTKNIQIQQLKQEESQIQRQLKLKQDLSLTTRSIPDSQTQHMQSRNDGGGLLFSAISEGTIQNNIIKNNTIGIRINSDSTQNVVVGNDFIDNQEYQAYDNGETTWNTTTNGNYWSDYTGGDNNNDGIGDTPYQIPSDSQNPADQLPLISSFLPTVDAGTNRFNFTGESLIFNPSVIGGLGEMSWKWMFSDGTISTFQNPTKTYNQAGIFTEKVTVTDREGHTSSDTITVTLAENEQVSAQISDSNSPMFGVEFAEVAQVSADASGGFVPYTWSWDFGDGTTAETKDAVHVYSNPGKYTLTLTVTDAVDTNYTCEQHIIVRSIYNVQKDKYYYTLNDAVYQYEMQDDHTVIVSQGIYPVDRAVCLFGDNSGTHGDAIRNYRYRGTIIGEDKHTTIVTNSDSFDGDKLFAIGRGSPHLTVSNFTFLLQDGCEMGVGVWCWHDVIKNNIFTTSKTNPPTHATTGIFLKMNYNHIEDNIFTNLTFGVHRPEKKDFYFEVQDINDNTFIGNEVGIKLDWLAWGIKINGNSFIENNRGIYSYKGLLNKIQRNTFVRNKEAAIYLEHSMANYIDHNNFISNTPDQAVDFLDSSGYNFWNVDYPGGGNYWNDFDEQDEGAFDNFTGESQNILGSDGIVDRDNETGGLNPYNITNPYSTTFFSQDRYPLIVPWKPSMDPVANFTYKEKSLVVEFNASTSYDPNDPIKSYTWDFGDGTTGTGQIISHEYDWYGHYNVTLFVTSNQTAANVTYLVKVDPPLPNQIFLEDFNGGKIDTETWINRGAQWWTTKGHDWWSNVPGHDVEYNRYSEIHTTHSEPGWCELEMKKPLDLSSYETVYFDMWFYVSREVDGKWEGLHCEVYDGSSWHGYWSVTSVIPNILNRWYHIEKWKLPEKFCTSQFKLRFWVLSSNLHKNIHTDDILLTGIPKEGNNSLPQPNFSFTPEQPSISERVSFTDLSTDSDGTVENWYWEFGDGSISHEQNPTYHYEESDTYVITLSVADNKEAVSSIQKPISVKSNDPDNVAPIADGNGPYLAYVGQSIHFNATASYDPDGDIRLYEWDYENDGIYDEWSVDSAWLNHSYTTPGNYTAVIRVTDSDGTRSTDTMNVTIVAPPEPTIYFFDDFESGQFINWTLDESDDWVIGNETVEDLPDKPSSNQVATCTKQIGKYGEVPLLMNHTVNLSNCYQAQLSLWRFVDDRHSYEYLKVYGWNGTNYREIFHWTNNQGDDDEWHFASIDLSDEFLIDDFKLKIAAKNVGYGVGDVVEIDDVTIEGIPLLQED